MHTPTRSKIKKVKGWAIVWKHNGQIEESYDNFEMNDTFSSLKGARYFIEKYFNAEHGWKKGYFAKDLKVVPVEITYTLTPTKGKKK